MNVIALLARLDGIEKDLQRERNRQEKADISKNPPTILASLAQMIRGWTTSSNNSKN